MVWREVLGAEVVEVVVRVDVGVEGEVFLGREVLGEEVREAIV